jgi:GTPase SAR1 family protein
MSLFKKKESNQSKKKKEKNKAKNENKKNESRNTKKVAHIKEAIPARWSDEYQCFIDNDDNFILMAKVLGTNIWGMKENDQYAYLNAFSTIFLQSINSGMIYSYEVPADVEGYINDCEVLKNTLNVTRSNVDRQRYSILNDNENRLKEVSVTRELVDRNFMIILKNKNYDVLKSEINTVCNILNNYQQTKPATPQEMLNTVYNYYNPTESEFVGTSYFDLDYGKMDLIYPDKLGILQRGLSSTMTINDNVYTRTKWIYTFMSEPTMALLGYCATFRCCDFSLHFEMAPHDIIKRDIDKTINNLNKNLNKEKNASTMAVIEKELENNYQMTREVSAEGSTPIYFLVSIRITADSPELLKERCKDVDNLATQLNIKFREGMHRPMEMFNLSSPLCLNQVPEYNQLTTVDTLGYMYPFTHEALYDSTVRRDKNEDVIYRYPPICIGTTKDTNGVLFYDNFTRKDDRANSNEAVFGSSGYGKTTYLMHLITQRFGIGYQQYSIDVEGTQLKKLTYALGGENIDCSDGDKGRINPLHVRITVPESEKEDEKIPLSDIKPLSSHIRFLRVFFDSYKGKGGRQDIRLLHDSLIEEALERTYKRIMNIDYQTSAEYIVEHFSNDDYPILSDLYDELKTMKIESEDANDMACREKISDCIAFIRPLAVGADAILFNGPTNINLNNPLINFDISGLQDNTGSRILLTQYFNILSFIWTQVISDESDTRKQIYADEYGVIMDPELQEVMKYFASISRRIRKRIGGLTVATQQISDVLKPEVKSEGHVIINQSCYQFFFNIAGETEYFKGTKILPESALQFIQFAKIGECYAKFGTQTSMTTQIIIPPDELRFFERIKK